MTLTGRPEVVQATSRVKLTRNGDVPAGGVTETDEVPLPLTAQPEQLALMNVLARLLAEMPTLPAPAWAVTLKLTGLPALTTNDEGEMPPTAALACGGAFAARNRPMAAMIVTGSNFNTRLLFIG
jgi:hypothetical protein